MSTATRTRPPARRAPSRPEPVVHEKIAARRDEIAHGRSRRRLFVLIPILVVLLLILAALGLSRSPVLAVARLDIDLGGSQNLTVHEVEAAAKVPLHTPLVGIDVDAVASRVAALPWVDHATVTRAWPHTLQISVVERRAVAQAPSAAGGFVLVDESGQVLAHQTEAEPGVVTLEVPPVLTEPGGNLGKDPVDALDLAGHLPKDLAAKLSTLRGSGAGLEAVVASGGTVRFCGTAELADKLLAVNTLLNRVDPATIGVLDVCVPSAPVLTPNGGGA